MCDHVYVLGLKLTRVSKGAPIIVVVYWMFNPIFPRSNKICQLQWCHNDRDGVSNRQPHDCLLNRVNRVFRRRSKKTSKLRVGGLCEGIHTDRWIRRTKGQNAENVSVWQRHHMRKIFRLQRRLISEKDHGISHDWKKIVKRFRSLETRLGFLNIRLPGSMITAAYFDNI